MHMADALLSPAVGAVMYGEFHGQRSLVGYSPRDCKGSDKALRCGQGGSVVPGLVLPPALQDTGAAWREHWQPI